MASASKNIAGKQSAIERILHEQGFGSRRECRALVRKGRVRVEGAPVDDPFAPFDAAGLNLSVDDVDWTCVPKVYVALHKPPGFECSRNPSHHQSVFELLPPHFAERGVQPAGRLDQDTTGLLLLSDDGPFIHRVTSPKHKVEKTYVATCVAPVHPDAVRDLLEGVMLRDAKEASRALRCRALEHDVMELVIQEGKYHQVKRMIAAAGNRCERLHRSALGALSLEGLGLGEGEWMLLDEAQRAALFP